MFITHSLKLMYYRFCFRRKNKHNKTSLLNICDLSKVFIGKNTYGQINVSEGSLDNYYLRIGSYCSIAPEVIFLLANEHNINTISTYPFKSLIFGMGREAKGKGDIIVEDDVWIGARAIICSGVKIGQGAVIASGSVVTKNVEPYAIVGGNPAHFIKWRFDEDIRKRLCELNLLNLFSRFDKDDISMIYKELNNSVLEELINNKL